MSSSHPASSSRRRRAIVAVLATLLAAGATFLSLSMGASAGTPPSITVTRTDSGVSIAGLSFAPRTKGRASFTNGSSDFANAVRTNKWGRFTTTFPLDPAYTGPVTVSATVGSTSASTTVSVPSASGSTTSSSTSSSTTSSTAAPTTTTTALTPVTDDALYGIQSAFKPVADLLVNVGQLSQSLLDSKPEGYRFALAAGVHRVTSPLRPRQGQQFLGYAGAIVSGSKVLSGWVQDGSRWYVTGQTQRLPGNPGSGYGAPICKSSEPLCNKPEDLFIDDQPRRQVSSLSELSAGRFYFDYSSSRIYIAEDPSGRTVETTTATGAFVDGGPNNVYRNIVVEKFGNAAQAATIRGTGLTVDHVEIRDNHGTGISQYGGAITNSRIIRNGQLGIAGGGSGLLVENNEIAWNNTEGHNPFWEAGGTKWAHSSNLTVRGNWVHHNRGSGLCTDINNYLALYEGNTIESNELVGLVHEISYDAVIRNNVIARNGTDTSQFFTVRVGLLVINSPNVQVYGNRLEDNTGGGVLGQQNLRIGSAQYPDTDGNVPTRGYWVLQNFDVHGNTVRVPSSATGAWGNWHMGLDIHSQAPDRNSFYFSKNNRFNSNTYAVPSKLGTAPELWFWTDGATYHDPKSFSQWRGLGMDTAGSQSSY